MKEAELRKHTVCSVCGDKILATGLPLFWKVTIERFGVDLKACKRQDGLATFVGSSKIAEVMGPDLDLASSMGPPIDLTVCETCGTGDPRAGLIVSALIEMEGR